MQQHYEIDDEEEEYRPLILKRRATAGYTPTTHPVNSREKPREMRNTHPVFSFGVGMCLVVFLLFLWSLVIAPWIHSIQLRWDYGTNQVSVFGADVGHGGVSRFIAFDNENEIVIVEVVEKKYLVYTIPTGSQQNRVVTLSVEDVNHDGKIDLVVRVDGEEGVFVLFNTGNAFEWTK